MGKRGYWLYLIQETELSDESTEIILNIKGKMTRSIKVINEWGRGVVYHEPYLTYALMISYVNGKQVCGEEIDIDPDTALNILSYAGNLTLRIETGNKLQS